MAVFAQSFKYDLCPVSTTNPSIIPPGHLIIRVCFCFSPDRRSLLRLFVPFNPIKFINLFTISVIPRSSDRLRTSSIANPSLSRNENLIKE